MVAFIDDHRRDYGIEPICEVLPIAPSTYYACKARATNPERRSQRAKRDEALREHVDRVWNANFRVYGVRKVWRQLRRDKCGRRRTIQHGKSRSRRRKGNARDERASKRHQARAVAGERPASNSDGVFRWWLRVGRWWSGNRVGKCGSVGAGRELTHHASHALAENDGASAGMPFRQRAVPRRINQ